jgi:polysaccharide export outer membrane protein
MSRVATTPRGTLALIIRALLVLGVFPLIPSSTSAQAPSSSMLAADNRTSAQPGDVVRLRIWREPDMSGDYTVDDAGTVTFPRLGRIVVGSMAADSLKHLLITEYAKYLRNPSVEVTLLRRVRVTGAVRTPGLYTADQTMRVRDVLALAGGATSDGHMDQVRLDRNGQSTRLDLRGSPRDNDMALRSGDQLYVPQRNWWARNTPVVAAILRVTGGLVVALAVR